MGITGALVASAMRAAPDVILIGEIRDRETMEAAIALAGTGHLAIATLQRSKLPTDQLRSKSWNEFSSPDAPPMQFVFTVCDNARAEVCPVWPGQPMTAHWGIEDPAAAVGSDEDKARAFTKAFRELDARIKIFTSLRLEMLDRMALQRQLDEIGSNTAGATTAHPTKA